MNHSGHSNSSSAGPHMGWVRRGAHVLGASLAVVMLTVVGAVSPALAAPPTAIFSIVDNATDVSISANIVITFSAPVTAGTTGSNVVMIVPPAPAFPIMIPANDPQVSIISNVVTINPTSNLTACTQYSLGVPNAAFANTNTPPEFYAGSPLIQFTTLTSGGTACPPTVSVQSPSPSVSTPTTSTFPS